MKKRTISLMLGILAVMLLVGVGFATWVISQGATQEANGTVAVDTVTDNRVYASVSFKDNVNKFVFGAPETMNTANAWLTNDGKLNGTETSSKEVLSVTIIVEVRDSDNNVLGEDDVTVTPTFTTNPVASYGSYLVSPASLSATYNEDDKVFEIVVAYTWGSAFGNQNPYNYFNAGTSIGTDRLAGLTAWDEEHQVQYENPKNNADAAHYTLNLLTALNDEAFKVTVEIAHN